MKSSPTYRGIRLSICRCAVAALMLAVVCCAVAPTTAWAGSITATEPAADEPAAMANNLAVPSPAPADPDAPSEAPAVVAAAEPNAVPADEPDEVPEDVITPSPVHAEPAVNDDEPVDVSVVTFTPVLARSPRSADAFVLERQPVDEQVDCFDGVDADIVLMFERAVVFTSAAELDAQKALARELLAEFTGLDSAVPHPAVFVGYYPDAEDGGTEAELEPDCAVDDYDCLDTALDSGLATSYVGGMNLADAIDVGGLGEDGVSGPLTTDCVRRYLIIFTDGTPNEPTVTPATPREVAAEAAADARAAGITVLAVYINIDPPPVDEVTAKAFVRDEIASSHETYFELSFPAAAASLAHQIAGVLCKDCNGNGIMDTDAAEPAVDADEDGVLDVCGDCDDDGTADIWQRCMSDDDSDCNSNGVLDSCDIWDGTSMDCNNNDVPDECELDSDEDGVPDDCERGPMCVDSDRDGYCNDVDNCVLVPNFDQSDADNDGVGNACDNCIDGFNSDQTDTDEDGIGDLCDGCPEDPEKLVPGRCGCDEPDTDEDGDDVIDCVDNCAGTANASQVDQDDDGVGDECDNCPLAANPDQADANENGVGDACEEATPVDPVPDLPDDEQSEPQPVPAVMTRGGCGFYNGVGLIGLPLTMLLWMGFRVRTGRRRLC